MVKIEDMFQHNNMSNAEHVVNDMHDILRSYYKVALKRIVDNLCMQAADYHLLTGPDTPLKMLTPEFIRSLTAEQLEEIAGEEIGVKGRRKELLKTIEDLEKGQKILSRP